MKKEYILPVIEVVIPVVEQLMTGSENLPEIDVGEF